MCDFYKHLIYSHSSLWFFSFDFLSFSPWISDMPLSLSRLVLLAVLLYDTFVLFSSLARDFVHAFFLAHENTHAQVDLHSPPRETRSDWMRVKERIICLCTKCGALLDLCFLRDLTERNESVMLDDIAKSKSRHRPSLWTTVNLNTKKFDSALEFFFEFDKFTIRSA